MKTKIVIAALAITLIMTCSTARGAGFVRIDDLASGTPIVTTDLLGGTFSNPNGPATITLGNEEATIAGFLPTPALLPFGQRSVIFQEQSTGQASDFVTLFADGYSGNAVTGFFQNVTVFFQSDGATGFATNIANLPNVVGSVTENGSYQDIITILGSSPLDVYVRSGEETSVPEPVTLFLFGTGLVGMAVIGRRKQIVK